MMAFSHAAADKDWGAATFSEYDMDSSRGLSWAHGTMMPGDMQYDAGSHSRRFIFSTISLSILLNTSFLGLP